MVKVLIVEDDPDIRELTSLYLSKKGFDVFATGDGYSALNIATHNVPDIILLDILLPGMEGYEICEKIRSISDAPIFFLSCKREASDKIKGFDVGADDYITKPFDLAELEARIKAHLRRSSNRIERHGKVFKCEHLEINMDSFEVIVDGQSISLYKKELQLLILLVENPNRVFSAEQLYDQIWGIDSVGDLKTVMVHISNLRRKIEKDPSKPKFIHTVRGFGYKFSTIMNHLN